MTLGRNIHRLRTERNLSQGDLADLLGVSRQSISKWETDGAVPELDKLLKLSELFQVTLDELVKGESLPGQTVPIPETVPVSVTFHTGLPTRKIVGIILFCVAGLIAILGLLLTGLLENLILALPFAICGTICFVCKKHPGLYCGWAVWLMADLFLRFGTSAHWTVILSCLRHPELFQHMTLQFIIGTVELLCMLLLLGMTIFLHRNAPMDLSRRQYILLGAGWVVYLLMHLPIHSATLNIAVQLVYYFGTCLRFILFSFLLTVTIHWLRQNKKK